jgi:type IV secretion system protein VirB5
VDRHGYEIAVNPVAPEKIDAKMIISRIGRYVKSFKTVYGDVVAQTELINFVYQSTPIGSAAESRYREYFDSHNPLVKGQTLQVHVIVNSVLPLSETKWQAEWTEEVFERGQRISIKQYRGIFDIVVHTPSTMKEVLENPLGIYVTDFNFSEITS